jgi:hypothetical protein
MGLIIKPPHWQYFANNYAAAPSTSPGTVITSGTAAEGSVVSLITALSYDCELLVVRLYASSATTAARPLTLDIMIDPAGGTSYSVLVENILGGQLNGAGSSGSWGGATYAFPLFIPAGARIGARCHADLNTTTVSVHVNVYGQNANPGSWWAGQRVTSYGVSGKDGTNHVCGNSGAYSSWTNFGSTLSEACGALQFSIGQDNASGTSLHYYLEFGVGGVAIGPPIMCSTNTTEALSVMPSMPIFCSLPAGTQLQVRGTCSGTAQNLRVAAHAVH